MRADRWNRVRELFQSALEVDVEERHEFLERATGGDETLLGEVEALLRADSAATGRLDAAFHDAVLGAEETLPDTLLGRSLGAYELRERVGEGGMGTVYLGVRAEEGYEHRAAVKVVRQGRLTAARVQRFQSERQILAGLEHPSIARLIDAGQTDDGVGFLVMEFVHGRPIDRYCDDERRSIPDRLRLFQDVCAAVQYAHQMLVVHRDIKPSNILVDEDGRVRLLDFGIAKMMDPDAEETATALRMLTPEYASPEQVLGRASGTSTDVYSLGVLLYELLCGRRPFRIDLDNPREIERQITDSEPERPSTTVSRNSDADEVANLAALRATTAHRLPKILSGDLDNIVLMALRKEPTRRYASPAALAEDIDRYLRGHPVVARPATWRYRAGKFVGRNRVASAAAGISLAAFGGWGVTSAIQVDRLAEERDRTAEALATAEETAAFLEDLFDVSRPTEALGDSITARQLLDAGAERIREELGDEPLVQARMMATIGGVYRSLGLYDEASALLTDALGLREAELGPDHIDVSEVLEELGTVATDRGAYGEAESVLLRSLAVRERLLGSTAPEVGSTLSALGRAYRLSDRPAEAERHLVRAVGILESAGEDAFDALMAARNNLSVAYEAQERFDEAVAIQEDVAAALEERFGPDDPRVASVLNNLANSLFRRGEVDRALPYSERVARSMERVLGPDHPQLAVVYANMAVMNGARGDLAAKLALERRALAIDEAALGPDHPSVGLTLLAMGRTFTLLYDFDEAEAVLDRAVDILEAPGPPTRRYLGLALRTLVDVFAFTARLEDHPELVERASRITAEVSPDDARLAGVSALHRGLLARDQGQSTEARDRLADAAARLEAVNPDDADLPRTLIEWAIAEARVGSGAASDVARRATEVYDRSSDRRPAYWSYALARLAALSGDLDEARRHLAEAADGGFPLDYARGDPDLASLANDPLFAERREGDPAGGR